MLAINDAVNEVNEDHYVAAKSNFSDDWRRMYRSWRMNEAVGEGGDEAKGEEEGVDKGLAKASEKGYRSTETDQAGPSPTGLSTTGNPTNLSWRDTTESTRPGSRNAGTSNPMSPFNPLNHFSPLSPLSPSTVLKNVGHAGIGVLYAGAMYIGRTRYVKGAKEGGERKGRRRRNSFHAGSAIFAMFGGEETGEGSTGTAESPESSEEGKQGDGARESSGTATAKSSSRRTRRPREQLAFDGPFWNSPKLVDLGLTADDDEPVRNAMRNAVRRGSLKPHVDTVDPAEKKQIDRMMYRKLRNSFEVEFLGKGRKAFELMETIAASPPAWGLSVLETPIVKGEA